VCTELFALFFIIAIRTRKTISFHHSSIVGHKPATGSILALIYASQVRQGTD
jgi:hypothetical protein